MYILMSACHLLQKQNKKQQEKRNLRRLVSLDSLYNGAMDAKTLMYYFTFNSNHLENSAEVGVGFDPSLYLWESCRFICSNIMCDAILYLSFVCFLLLFSLLFFILFGRFISSICWSSMKNLTCTKKMCFIIFFFWAVDLAEETNGSLNGLTGRRES